MKTTALRCTAAALAIAGASLITSAASAEPLGYAGPFARQDTIFGGIFGNQPTQQPAVEETQDQDATETPANLRRQVVAYSTQEAPGTIIVDTPNTYLYFI